MVNKALLLKYYILVFHFFILFYNAINYIIYKNKNYSKNLSWLCNKWYKKRNKELYNLYYFKKFKVNKFKKNLKFFFKKNFS